MTSNHPEQFSHLSRPAAGGFAILRGLLFYLARVGLLANVGVAAVFDQERSGGSQVPPGALDGRSSGALRVSGLRRLGACDDDK
jgi:hypothetical protein